MTQDDGMDAGVPTWQELKEERDRLYKLLAALVWDQEKHVLHISRHAWKAMGNMGQYKLVQADAPDGTVRLAAKFDPVRKFGRDDE